MSLVKGLARPVPDFARLHALEEQRVARWKRQHKKELTGPCNAPCAAHAFVRRRHPAQVLSSMADSRYACGCLAVPKGFKLWASSSASTPFLKGRCDRVHKRLAITILKMIQTIDNWLLY